MYPASPPEKKTSISFDDIIQFDPMVYYQYGQIKETAFDGEGQITSAIRYVTSDTAAAVYTLTGHGETALSSAVSDAMDKSGMKAADLNLLTQGAVPQDCSLLNGIPFVPQKLRNFPAILEDRKIQTNPL